RRHRRGRGRKRRVGGPPLVGPPLVGHEVVGHEVVRPALVVRGMGGRDGVRHTALKTLTGAIAVSALALFVLVVRDLPSYELGRQLPWWALAAAFAATELFVVHAYVRGSAHSLSISELPLILGLLLASPQDVVIAQIAGPMLVLALTRGHSPMKLVFN